MKGMLTKAVTHREFLKLCGLAIVGGGAGQLVTPPQSAAAFTYTNLTVSDRIGIGTENPSVSLHTTGDIRLGSSHIIADGHLVLDIGPESGRKLWIRKDLTSGDPSTYTTVMVVENTGNVGIGTTGPGAKLEIVGPVGGYGSCALTVRVNSTSSTFKDQIRVLGDLGSTTEPYGILFGGDGHGRGGIYAINTGGTGSSNGLIGIWSRNGGAIYLDGKVGIGTTTPDAKLQVAGSVHIDGPLYFTTPSDPNYKIELYSWPGSAAIRMKAWGAATLATSFGDVLVANGAGNVGIATTNPEARLHLASGAIKINSRVIADDGGCYYA